MENIQNQNKRKRIVFCSIHIEKQNKTHYEYFLYFFFFPSFFGVEITIKQGSHGQYDSLKLKAGKGKKESWHKDWREEKGTRGARGKSVPWISWHLASPCLCKPKPILALDNTFLLQCSKFQLFFIHLNMLSLIIHLTFLLYLFFYY